jgi:tRNA (guanine-N7-)-methyltransferase
LRLTRTTEHLARITGQRDELRARLLEILRPGGSFVWEVGSGHGHFLTAYAAAHPGEFCVGVDIASDRVGRADRKRERARLPNLHFLFADAADFLATVPVGARLSAIFILFPDPWPKRRHHKNRVLSADFLTAAGALANPGAGLYFRTDHEPYFRAATAVIRGHPLWQEAPGAGLPFEEPTVFEKRALRHFTLVALRR